MLPRERLQDFGAHTLSDAELLAILLRTGRPNPLTPGIPGVITTAETILQQFSSLKELLDLPAHRLQSISGLGPSKSATLLAVKEISKRLWKNYDHPQKKILSVQDAYELFSDLGANTQESLHVALLNSQQQLIARKLIFLGSLTHCHVSPREILKEALTHNATKVIIAHNHPSQNPEPSPEDTRFTHQLKKACSLIGITLLDHLIICLDGRYRSFRQDWQPTPKVSASR